MRYIWTRTYLSVYTWQKASGNHPTEKEESEAANRDQKKSRTIHISSILGNINHFPRISIYSNARQSRRLRLARIPPEVFIGNEIDYNLLFLFPPVETGNNGPVYLSQSDDSETGRLFHRFGLGLFESHQFPGHRLVEGRGRGRSAFDCNDSVTKPNEWDGDSSVGSGRFCLCLYRRHWLFGLFIDRLFLRAAVRHGLHLLPHLQGGRRPVTISPSRHQAGSGLVRGIGRTGRISRSCRVDFADPPRGKSRFGQPQMRRSRRPFNLPGRPSIVNADQFNQRPTTARRRRDSGRASFIPSGRTVGLIFSRRRRRRAGAHQQNELFSQPQIGQNSQRTQSGQVSFFLLWQKVNLHFHSCNKDTRDRDGRVHRLLAPVLRHQFAVGLLPGLHPRHGARRHRRHLARMDQFGNESRHLRLLVPRFQEVKFSVNWGRPVRHPLIARRALPGRRINIALSVFGKEATPTLVCPLHSATVDWLSVSRNGRERIPFALKPKCLYTDFCIALHPSNSGRTNHLASMALLWAPKVYTPTSSRQSPNLRLAYYSATPRCLLHSSARGTASVGFPWNGI